MANWFSRMFQAPTTNKPSGEIGQMTMTATPEGRLYSSTLKERLAGRGVGFPEDYVSATTSPYAKSIRSGYQEFTKPQIAQESSARGLGRSTIPVNRMALESSRAEQGIGELVAQAYAQQEAQKRAEINAALTGLGSYAAQEAGLAGQRAGLISGIEQGDANRQLQGTLGGAQIASDVAKLILTGGISGAELYGKFKGLPGFTTPSSGSAVNVFTGDDFMKQLEELINQRNALQQT